MGRGAGGGGRGGGVVPEGLYVPRDWKKDTRWRPGAAFSIRREREGREVVVYSDNPYQVVVDFVGAGAPGSHFRYANDEFSEALSIAELALNEGYSAAISRFYGV